LTKPSRRGSSILGYDDKGCCQVDGTCPVFADTRRLQIALPAIRAPIRRRGAQALGLRKRDRTDNRRSLLLTVVLALVITCCGVLPNTRDVDVQPESYWKTGDLLQIVTLITVGIGDEVIGRTLSEESGSVRVTLRVREATGTRPGLGIRIPVAITLKQPLGTRVVQDATGKPVPEIDAPSYGAP
jgi:hypothetical protein